MAFHEPNQSNKGSRAEVLADAVPAFGLSAKRLFDIVGAATALILLTPLFVIIAVAIKLKSRGPIFCRKTIYGYKKPGSSRIWFSIDEG